ncbi:MAG: hypothetical protein HeimC3_22370 [Candidatus Heimdallarchaeota archaeon LC_3]|nr:MAG: hypothetical protein HeimC3_22370 [Candidatus Heimdallarchaeota archaeon LC_3]
MKRHEALQPLSRDHYVGLTLAMRLIRGKPENLKSNWPPNNNLKLQAQQAIQIFEKDLYDHFKEEKNILFDKAKSFLQENEGKGFLERVLKQHDEFYKLFQELDQGSEDIIKERLVYTGEFQELDQGSEDIIKERLVYTGELLDNHVRIEERDLFPAIENFTPVSLNEFLELICVMNLKTVDHSPIMQ